MRRFEFRFDPRWRGWLSLLGITPLTSSVDVDHDEDRLLVRFGPWRVDTGLDNIGELHRTDDYRWYRAIGPHLSLADRGLSFGTNLQHGLCVHFRRPVPGLDPLRLMRHPALTLTVADIDGLANALSFGPAFTDGAA